MAADNRNRKGNKVAIPNYANQLNAIHNFSNLKEWEKNCELSRSSALVNKSRRFDFIDKNEYVSLYVLPYMFAERVITDDGELILRPLRSFTPYLHFLSDIGNTELRAAHLRAGDGEYIRYDLEYFN